MQKSVKSGVVLAGVILGYYAMESPESFEPIIRHLDEHLYPRGGGPLPDYFVYDRACQLRRALHLDGSLREFLQRWWKVRLIVDRFHFYGHSRDDAHCW